jgi:hypothetical protein
MKYDRSLLALVVGIFLMPFLLGLLFYSMALVQQDKFTWEGFQTTHWAGPYYLVGAVLCVIIFAISLYWLKKDNKSRSQKCIEPQADIETPESNRIIHSVTIKHEQWEKFQKLGGVKWLDQMIDEA